MCIRIQKEERVFELFGGLGRILKVTPSLLDF